MISMKLFFVFYFMIQCFKLTSSKPIFKGINFKKNYEVEISAIPFKHISFIKEKWFPFKMLGIHTHDIAKREVVEDPKDENIYSVNEVTFDNEVNGNFPGLYTSVNQDLDLNSDGEVVPETIPVPIVDNKQSIHIKPVLDAKNVATGIMHTSSVIPIQPSIIIAPSIHTTGTAVQPAAVVPIDVVECKDIEVQPLKPLEENITPIQPMHTRVDVPSVQKLEESVSKMHTDISSAVPLNTLVASPVQEMDLPLPIDVKKEEQLIEPPKVVEEIKVQPVVEPPIVETPVLVPVEEPPPAVPVEVPTPSKPGPVGLLMRGTRFVLYFGSVMLQLLSQMISGSPPNLNQLTEPLALN